MRLPIRCGPSFPAQASCLGMLSSMFHSSSPFKTLFFFSPGKALYSANMSPQSSCCTNGFGISSLPSTGLTSTSRVPLATTRPNAREDSLPSSSEEQEVSIAFCAPGEGRKLTSQHLLHIIQNQIHQGIVAFQHARNCIPRSSTRKSPENSNWHMEHTFSSSIKLHCYALVHILPQIQNVLLLRPLPATMGMLRCMPSPNSTTSAASMASASSSTASPMVFGAPSTAAAPAASGGVVAAFGHRRVL